MNLRLFSVLLEGPSTHNVSYVRETFTSGFVVLAAIAQWQDQIEWGLRIAVAIIAIIVGLLNIRSLMKKDKLVAKQTILADDKVEGARVAAEQPGGQSKSGDIHLAGDSSKSKS
jgi:hypothetical protein